MIIPGFEELELSPNQAIEMAERVKGLASNTAFQYLLARSVKSAVQRWADGKTWQDREAAHQQMAGIRAVETEIEKIVDQGIRAAADVGAATSGS